MQRLLSTLFTAVLIFALTSHVAEAARLGGGSSSGMSRSGSVMNRQAVPPKPAAPAVAPTPAPAAAPAAAPARSPWMGMLGGLALGAGIGALLNHFGLGGLGGFGGILMALLAGVAVVFLVRMLLNRNQAQPLQYAGTGTASNGPAALSPQAVGGGAAVAATTGSIPAGFDVDGFVRQAKLNFIRLQAANDAGNLEDIRAFTTPEMYAEIQMEYQERNRAVQQTDVIQLNAELLDIANEEARQIASVRFHGSIRENANAAPEAFDEVWHLTKPVDGSHGWVIAGIQQYS